MLRDPHLTDGIGARIAHSIYCISTKDALRDRSLTSVISAKKRKTKKAAQHKERARIVKKLLQSKCFIIINQFPLRHHYAILT